MLMGTSPSAAHSGRLALLSGSCSLLHLTALDHDKGTYLTVAMQRQSSASQAHKVCSHMIEPVCDGAPEDSLMW